MIWTAGVVVAEAAHNILILLNYLGGYKLDIEDEV
jgi:hypothetical protein